MTVTFPAAAKRTADPRCHNQSYYLRRAIHRHAILTRQDFRGVLSRLALACGVDPASIATSVYPIDQRPILHDVLTALIAERTAFLSLYCRYIQQRRSEKRSGGAQPRHADLQCLYAPAYLDPRCTPVLPYEAHRSSVGRVGYLNPAGDWALQPQFAAAQVFTDGVAAVKVADAWGYIDLTGAWRIEPQYFTAGYVSAGKAEVGELDHGRLKWKVVPIPAPDRAETEQ